MQRVKNEGQNFCGSVRKAGDSLALACFFSFTGHKGKKEMLLGIDAQYKTRPTAQRATKTVTIEIFNRKRLSLVIGVKEKRTD